MGRLCMAELSNARLQMIMAEQRNSSNTKPTKINPDASSEQGHLSYQCPKNLYGIREKTNPEKRKRGPASSESTAHALTTRTSKYAHTGDNYHGDSDGDDYSPPEHRANAPSASADEESDNWASAIATSTTHTIISTSSSTTTPTTTSPTPPSHKRYRTASSHHRTSSGYFSDEDDVDAKSD
ncbi:hypothetical protein Pelo_1693 [Pelomyxa schiedti]|nr:hypothetical protein Pelo_1693 [Pelomyxa schiedti]